MKKFTLLLVALLAMIVAQAATPVKMMPQRFISEKGIVPTMSDVMHAKKAPEGLVKKIMTKTVAQVKARKSMKKAPKKTLAIADLEGTYTWEYETVSLQQIQNNGGDLPEDPDDIQGAEGSLRVTIEASDEAEDGIIITGMFDNPITATVTLAQDEEDYDTFTIDDDQTAGVFNNAGTALDYTVSGVFYYDGDEQYEAGFYTTSVFGYIFDDGILFATDTWIERIITTAPYDGYTLYPIWKPGSIMTASEPLNVVVAPENLVTEEYTLTYSNYNEEPASGSVFIGFDGNDVYVKGLCGYIKDAWLKGTLNNGTVTFAGDQYFGNFGGFDFFFQENDAVFTYDATNATFTAADDIYTYYDTYYENYYRELVMKKVIEKAAMPANPQITNVATGQYGWYMIFNVPVVDTNGDGLAASKLYYQVFVDVEKEVSQLTFTPATHTRLTEAISTFPYGFTENYDIYDTSIYFNDLFSEDWNKIGIKSIYYGGGETNETEIQWYTIKKYADELAFDNAQKALTDEIAAAKALKTQERTEGLDEFNTAIADAEAALADPEATTESLEAATVALQQAEETFTLANMSEDERMAGEATWIAKNQGYANAEELGEFKIDDFLTGEFAAGTYESSSKYYTSNGPVRFYAGNTLTISGNDGIKKITKIQFTFSSKTYAKTFTVDNGTYAKEDKYGLWTGESKEVTFTNAESGQARIAQIDVFYVKSETAVGIENVETAQKTVGGIYNLQGQRMTQVPQKGLYIMDGKKFVIK